MKEKRSWEELGASWGESAAKSGYNMQEITINWCDNDFKQEYSKHVKYCRENVFKQDDREKALADFRRGWKKRLNEVFAEQQNNKPSASRNIRDE